MPKTSSLGIGKAKILLIAFAAAALWSFSTVLSKGLFTYLPPLTQLMVQLCTSNIFLWLAVICSQSPLPKKSQLLPVLMPGLLQPGISNILFILGLSLTSVSNETLISVTETILTILLAWLLLGERIDRASLSLAGLAFMGVVLITFNGNITLDSSWLGNLLTLGSASCFALYAILCRRLVTQFDPLVLLCLHQSFGLILVAMVWLITLPWLGLTQGQIPFFIWPLAGLSGIGLYAIPFWLYIILLKHTKAGIAAIFLSLIPVFGIAGAYIFLGETLSLHQVVGGGLILISVIGISVLQSK